MNPMYLAVMSRVIANRASRCPICDSRIQTVSSGKHHRRKCVTCETDVAARAAAVPPATRRTDASTGADRVFRLPSRRRQSARS